MSRIGMKPINIPENVEINVDKNNNVSAKGPKGDLNNTFSNEINIIIENNTIIVTRNNDEKESKSLHGLTRSLLNNMIIGVSEGYSKSLEMVGVGYRAEQKPSAINLSVMKSHIDVIEAPEGITIKVEDNTKITVSGIDKQQVGHIAALIRSSRPPNPYTGKGVRYLGEQVSLKPGKSARAET